MLRWRKRIRRMTYLMTDLLCLVIASLVANILYAQILGRKLNINTLENFGFLCISTLVLMMMFLFLSIYDNTIEEEGMLTIKVIFKMIVAYGVSTLLIGAGLFYLHVPLSRLYIGIFILVVMFLQLINRLIMRMTQFKDSVKSEAVRNILVVGQSQKGSEYIEEIEKHGYLNFNIVGYLNIKKVNPYSHLPIWEILATWLIL